jgi:hypothetical protein
VFAVSNASAQQEAKRIAETDALLSRTNEQIAGSHADGEYSSVYLAEMIVNKNNGSYPAVGIFRTIYRFYYTYGDREKNPYPNRLIKIEIETKRSDRTETTEFLFDEGGKLIFYLDKKDEADFRIYFAAEKPLKLLKGERDLKTTDREAVQSAKNALAEKRKLGAIFSELLDY